MFTELKVVYIKEQWSFRKYKVILTNNNKRPPPHILKLFLLNSSNLN